MLNDDTRKKLENIIGGIVLEGNENYCEATRNFLCQRFSTSTTVKRNFEGLSAIKEEQVVLLKEYATQTSGWQQLFQDTAYTFLGFIEKDDQLMAVLKQSFITADDTVDLTDIKSFLTYNGFMNIRNNDYYSYELGLILEDFA